MSMETHSLHVWVGSFMYMLCCAYACAGCVPHAVHMRVRRCVDPRQCTRVGCVYPMLCTCTYSICVHVPAVLFTCVYRLCVCTLCCARVCRVCTRQPIQYRCPNLAAACSIHNSEGPWETACGDSRSTQKGQHRPRPARPRHP